MKRLLSLALPVLVMVFCLMPAMAFADALVPSVWERNGTLILVLVIAVVIIAAVVLYFVIRKRKK